MINYTIYCTEAQTKKALELGAPIKPRFELFTPNLNNIPHCHTYIDGEDVILFIPTAEQMINWLEEQDIYLAKMNKGADGYFYYLVSDCKVCGKIYKEGRKITRKEATLAAIDVALEYLTNNKK